MDDQGGIGDSAYAPCRGDEPVVRYLFRGGGAPERAAAEERHGRAYLQVHPDVHWGDGGVFRAGVLVQLVIKITKDIVNKHVYNIFITIEFHIFDQTELCPNPWPRGGSPLLLFKDLQDYKITLTSVVYKFPNN